VIEFPSHPNRAGGLTGAAIRLSKMSLDAALSAVPIIDERPSKSLSWESRSGQGGSPARISLQTKLPTARVGASTSKPQRWCNSRRRPSA